MDSSPHPGSPPVLWARLLSLLPGAQAQSVQRAYRLAFYAHDGQQRDGDEGAYIMHPLRVALILAKEMELREPALLSIALLHDVLEDSEVDDEEVERVCGAQVLVAVQALSKPPLQAEQSKAERDAAYYATLAAAPQAARLVKCADRVDNLRSLQRLGDARRLARYVTHTEQYVLPLAAATDPWLYAALQRLCEAE